MSKKRSNFIVRGGADFSSINKAMGKTQKQLRSFHKNTSRIMKGIAVALAAIGLRRIIRNATDAYDYQIEQEAKLTTIMRRRMGANNEMIQSIKQLTATQQKLGIIGDEVQLAGAQQLATFLKSNESLKILIPAMNNLAVQQKGYNATGQDLVNISNMMGRVMEGQVGALRRVGISFTEAEERVLSYGNEQERASMLAKIIENNVGNMNEALAKTPRGRWQQIKNDFGDVNEQIGKAFVSLRDMFIPAMQYLARITLVVAKSLQRAFSIMNTLFGRKQAQQVENISKVNSRAIGSIEDLGDSYEEAAQKARRSVAGFDEINTLSDASGGSPNIGGLFDNLSEPMSIGDGVTISDELVKVSDRLRKMLEPVKTSFEKLKASAQPLIDTLGNALSGFYNKVLVPFGTWTIAEAVPAFMNLLSGALDILNPLLLAFKPLGEWLWTNFLQPLAAWTGVMFIESINGVANALSAIGNWMSKNKPVTEKITKAVVLFMAAWKITQLLAFAQLSGGVVAALSLITKSLIASTTAKIADKIATVALTMMYAKDFVVGIGKATVALVKNASAWMTGTAVKVASTVATWAAVTAQAALTVATTAWNVICGVATALTTAFGVAIAILTSPIGLVVLAIGALIGVGVLLCKNWDTVLDWGRKLGSGLTATFRTMGEAIGRVLKGIINAFTSMINTVTRGLNNMFSGVLAPFNAIIKGMNRLPGVNMPTLALTIPQLPFLAKGGITNGPMAAIIGDNPGGREVVSPLDDLLGMVNQAVTNAVGNSGSSDDTQVILKIGEMELGRAVLKSLKKLQRISGESILEI